MKTLARLDSLLRSFERGFLVLLFSLMIVLSFSQVILRNVFSLGLVWADPLLRNSVLWLGFIGASLATQEDRHIKIDLIGRFLKPRATALVGMATDVFTFAVCVLLADAAMTFVTNEIEFRDTLVTIGGFEVPTWWSQVILPAGFVLIALRVAVRFTGRIVALSGRGAAEPPPGPGPAGGAA